MLDFFGQFFPVFCFIPRLLQERFGRTIGFQGASRGPKSIKTTKKSKKRQKEIECEIEEENIVVLKLITCSLTSPWHC